MWRLNEFLLPGERLLLDIAPWKAVNSRFGGFILVTVWAALFMLPELEYFRRFDPWMVAVTDRRVLVRKRLFSKHFTDMNLSEIERVEHDWQADRVILVGREHALEIRCNNREAAAILEALKGAYQPRKTFWQRLRGL